MSARCWECRQEVDPNDPEVYLDPALGTYLCRACQAADEEAQDEWYKPFDEKEKEFLDEST